MRRFLIAILALSLLAPAVAFADRSEELLLDACRDEVVDGRYSQEDYRRALDDIPADSDQYTNCRDVIRQAQLAAASGRDPRKSGGAGGGASGGSGGGSTGAAPTRDPLASATPEERKAVEAVTEAGAAPVRIAGRTVTPGALGLGGAASPGADLPTELIVLLALLGATALGAAGWAVRNRVLARRTG